MLAARLALKMLASHRQRLLQRLNPAFGSFPFRNLWPGTTPRPSQQEAAASLWLFQQWLCMVEGAALISVELEGLGMEEAARGRRQEGLYTLAQDLPPSTCRLHTTPRSWQM